MKQLLHTPEGVRDIYNEEYANKLKIEKIIRKTMNRYGYKDIQTPTFEFFDIFRKERGSVSSQEMFKFFDRNGNTLVLRPDMTPSVARCASKYFSAKNLPIRLCYLGNTFINNSSYRGRLKECTDAGAECIGDNSIYADAEIIAMLITALKACGLEEFQIDIGHSGFLKGFMEEANLAEDVKEQIYVLLKNKNFFALESLLLGLQLDNQMQQVFTEIQQYSGSIEQVESIRTLLSNEQSIKAIERMVDLYKILGYYDYQKYISFDLCMVTEYRYYTGIIFNGYTYGTGDAIVSGGRYDSLMKQFGNDAPAVGFKISVDDLLMAMSRQNIKISGNDISTLLVYNNSNQKEGIILANRLRESGLWLQTQCLSDNKTLENALIYAKENDFPYVLYINEAGVEVKVINTQDNTENVYAIDTFTKEAVR